MFGNTYQILVNIAIFRFAKHKIQLLPGIFLNAHKNKE